MICRLLIEPEARDGAWNMAYDEALLNAAATRGEIILRIYRWMEPTLSLGYFQKSLPAGLPLAISGLPCVRRLSGGGAILHHLEWTYSCVVPKDHVFARRTETLYEEAHHALIRAFATYGIHASLRGESIGARDSQFLCFLRGDARDVMVGGHKVVGSAQRRRRGAILQHGSVLLKRSPLAPEVPGLFDLASGVGEDSLFAAERFCTEFGARLFVGDPVPHAHADDVSKCSDRIMNF